MEWAGYKEILYKKLYCCGYFSEINLPSGPFLWKGAIIVIRYTCVFTTISQNVQGACAAHRFLFWVFGFVWGGKGVPWSVCYCEIDIPFDFFHSEIDNLLELRPIVEDYKGRSQYTHPSDMPYLWTDFLTKNTIDCLNHRKISRRNQGHQSKIKTFTSCCIDYKDKTVYQWLIPAAHLNRPNRTDVLFQDPSTDYTCFSKDDSTARRASSLFGSMSSCFWKPWKLLFYSSKQNWDQLSSLLNTSACLCTQMSMDSGISTILSYLNDF